MHQSPIWCTNGFSLGLLAGTWATQMHWHTKNLHHNMGKDILKLCCWSSRCHLSVALQDQTLLANYLGQNLLPPQWFPDFITVGEDPHESWSFPRHVKFASWASETWQPPSLAKCCSSETIAIQYLVSLGNGIFVAETLKTFITPTMPTFFTDSLGSERSNQYKWIGASLCPLLLTSYSDNIILRW